MPAPRFNVQPHRRLIQKHQVRVTRKRPAQTASAASAPPLKLAKHAIFKPLQPSRYANQRRIRHRPRIVPAKHRNMFAHAQHLGRSCPTLQHRAGARSAPPCSRGSAPKILHRCLLVGARKPQHQLHRRRFTRAIRPQQRHNLASAQRQRKPIERHHTILVPLSSRRFSEARTSTGTCRHTSSSRPSHALSSASPSRVVAIPSLKQPDRLHPSVLLCAAAIASRPKQASRHQQCACMTFVIKRSPAGVCHSRSHPVARVQ